MTVALATLFGCQGEPVRVAAPVQSAAAPGPALPPPAKELLHLVMRNSELPLSLDPSCEGVATDRGNATMGHYLSGFWAAQTGPEGRNWVETACEPSGGKVGWQCRVMLRRQAGEEEWGWGVGFVVKPDRTMDRTSLRCLGGG